MLSRNLRQSIVIGSGSVGSIVTSHSSLGCIYIIRKCHYDWLKKTLWKGSSESADEIEDPEKNELNGATARADEFSETLFRTVFPTVQVEAAATVCKFFINYDILPCRGVLEDPNGDVPHEILAPSAKHQCQLVLKFSRARQ